MSVFIEFLSIFELESIDKFIPETDNIITEFVIFVDTLLMFILLEPAIFINIVLVFSKIVSFYDINIFSKELT